MGALSPPAHARYPVRMEEDVGTARRAVGRLAEAAGVPRGDAELVATELATNIIRHAAGDGYLLCGAGQGWLELLAVDHGPGLGAVGHGLALAGLTPAHAGAPCPGRTASPPPRPGQQGRSPGLGMGIAAVRRLCGTFDFYSSPRGVVTLARFGEPGRAWPRLARWGAVNVPMSGNGESGDGWAVAADGVLAALVVDGLGHGPAAAAAAAAALEAFQRAPVDDPGELLDRAHQAMRQTRGGVLWACVIDPAREELAFAAVGNVLGRLLHAGRSHGLAGRDGTVGTQPEVPRCRAERHPWRRGATLVVASDGIGSRWDPAAYPGLFSHDPVVAAAVLYRDHEKGTDDATVLVVSDVRQFGQ